MEFCVFEMLKVDQIRQLIIKFIPRGYISRFKFETGHTLVKRYSYRRILNTLQALFHIIQIKRL